MAPPIIVPRGAEPWSQVEIPLRVEYLDRESAARRTVYFDDSAAALAFAAEHRLYGSPCVVESKDMPVLFVLENYSLNDEDYVFSRMRFGDRPTAMGVFAERKVRAAEVGGAYRLIETATGATVERFENSVD